MYRIFLILLMALFLFGAGCKKAEKTQTGQQQMKSDSTMTDTSAYDTTGADTAAYDSSYYEE